MAVLLVALVLGVSLADPVACPDGCTDDAPAGAAAVATASCSFCHGWNGTAAMIVATAVARAAPSARTPPEASPRPAFAALIDHPPRLL